MAVPKPVSWQWQAFLFKKKKKKLEKSLSHLVSWKTCALETQHLQKAKGPENHQLIFSLTAFQTGEKINMTLNLDFLA